ncbi:MAG: hypothetical protein AAF512_13445, partial [Pseudomonadota bacterium]
MSITGEMPKLKMRTAPDGLKQAASRPPVTSLIMESSATLELGAFVLSWPLLRYRLPKGDG